MTKVENKILDFIEKKKEIIAIVFFAMLGLIIRYYFRDYKTSDYNGFLEIWFNEIKEGGGFKGIAHYTGNYNYAYVTILAFLTYLPISSLYTIKFVSVIFDVLCAVAIGLLVKEVTGKKQYFSLAFGITFLWPTVMFNSAYWAQCDAIYTTFIVLSILFLLKEKYPISFILIGIGVAFKLQAVFILPLFVLVYFVNRKFSILNFLYAPLGTLIFSLPGMILSKGGLSGFINTYVGQMNDSDMLTKNFPNIYYWISANHYELFNRVGILFTVVVLFSVYYIVYGKAKELSNSQILSMALWTILCLVYFLPNMHERYGYAAEVLCIAWAFKNKRWAWYPILMETIILFCYFSVIFGYNLYLFQNMGAVNIAVFVFFSIYILRDICAGSDGSKEQVE